MMFRLVVGLALFHLPMAALKLPAGTELQIRLLDKVSSETSASGQTIRAAVIAPVVVEGAIGVSSGAEVHGIVKEAKALDPANPKQQASLLLNFTELRNGAATTPINATLVSIDNARETIDADGRIQGMIPSDTTTALIDRGLGKLEEKYGGLAGILQAAKGAMVKDADASITYGAGVEMTIKLAADVEVRAAAPPNLTPIPNEAALAALVNRQPFQTYATKPPVKSDITNLMFIGTKEGLTEAFAASGWANADALNDQSKFKTAQALIEQRGYRAAPVSVLILDDRPPDLVYQKGNNTFAARHHLRIWRSPDDFQGKPVWISSSTHDVGIDFSQQSMTFIHKIDPNIDAERAKVVNDLLFTGKVKSIALVPRPQVPEHSRNATGDSLDTDAAMAVLLLTK
jgi:hypothetical protein